MADPHPDALIEGSVVDARFRLGRLLGRGAAGSVWEAEHLVLHAPVAIKFLDQLGRHLPTEEELALYTDRFRFEAQVSARLASRTSHTVAVHDAGSYRETPYLVMELAAGRSLEDVLEASVILPDEEILRLAEHIGEALGAAHDLGIVHRDVKPANILCLEREGQPRVYKLADFGLARGWGGKALDLPAPKKTAEGLIVGTPAYMAPEQIAAAGEYGPEVDLWALAVVLYEASSGRLPFEGSSITELALSISARPHQRADPRLDVFFRKALAKRPELRFRSASELVAALREALAGRDLEPVAAPVEEPVPPRRRLWPVVAGALFLACAIGGGAAFFSRARPVEQAASSSSPASIATAAPDPVGGATVEPQPEVRPASTEHAVAEPRGTTSSKRARSAPSAAPTPSVAPAPAVSAPPPPPADETAPRTIHRDPIDKSAIQ
jgi:serine/threonine-protein kinase